MNLKSIIVWVVIVLVLYLVWLWAYGDSWDHRLVGLHDATKMKVVPGNRLPGGATSDYTFSVWIYVTNWNIRIGEPKVIFGRLDADMQMAPEVSLDPTLNNVIVTLATYAESHNTLGKEVSGSGTGSHTCTLENVPLQTWANIIMTVNNRTLDLYLDGKLVRTCVLPGVPKVGTGSDVYLTPNGGFAGYTGNFQYFSRSVNPREAYAIYREGPGSGSAFSDLFNKYRVKISFLKDNRTINSFEI